MKLVEQLKRLLHADFVALHDEGDGWCDCTDRPDTKCIELPNAITLCYR